MIQKMKYDVKIGVIGGDERQLTIASELAHEGFEVAIYGFGNKSLQSSDITRCASLLGAIKGSSAIILPVPYSQDGIGLNCPLGDETEKELNIETLFSMFSPGQLVMGGKFTLKIKSMAEASSIKLIDYYLKEDLNILNAVPTAEGALSIAINELPITIQDSCIHILGFGRIGKVLAKNVSSLGAKVTVYARSDSDLAWARVFGYKVQNINSITADNYPFSDANAVFNTVPKQIITKAVLEKVPKEILIIDLASSPGGVDREAAAELKIKNIWALSLPGKTAPTTSGKIICESIFGILREEKIFPNESVDQ